MNARDIEALPSLISPEIVGHEPAGDVVGFTAARSNIEAWLSSYSDHRIETRDLFAHRDRIPWRWQLDGRHRPSGRRVAVEGIGIFRLESGRIAEYWGHYHRLGMLQQQDATS